MTGNGALRDEIEDLYADYAAAIDDVDLDRWTEFFADPCLYRIVSKENYDRNLPLNLMLCESHGMLKDRALASGSLNVYAPRSWRHSITQIRPTFASGPIAVRANFAVFETIVGQPTTLLCSGRYLDRLIRDGDRLKFREKLCIYDTAMIPGSIVLPL